MTDTTRMDDDNFYFGEVEFSNIIRRMVTTFKFHNSNRVPTAIHIPMLDTVDGVDIVYDIKE